MPDDQGIMGWVLGHGVAARINNPNEDKRLVSWPKFGRTDGAVLAVPLTETTRVAGVLVMMRLRSGEPFTDDELQLVENFAELASISLRNAAIHSAAETRARTDPLTGLRNREALEGVLERHMASGASFSLLLIDVDHFKRVNDDFGHLAGDRVLGAVAAALQAEARGGDQAFRFGGDEFLLVLPSTGLEGALAAANRLMVAIRANTRAAITAMTETHSITIRPVTCSMGLASFPEHGQTPSELIAGSDRAAYRAKAMGRNQVQVANRASAVGGVSGPLIP
jgi:two-component system, cell cycle response regulator